MKKTLRSIEKGMKYFILEKTFASRKKFITKMTPIDEVKDLIKQLYPVVCKKGLIRFGPEGDGGYLIPDDLEGIEACFSPGVSTASGFEKDCANQNMKVFLADASVSAPTQKHDLFDFIPMFVGSINNDNYLTLDKWVNSKLPNSNSDLLLQMDIEGSEYEAFHSLSEDTIKRFRIMVIEFHDLDEIWNYSYFKIISRVFKKILQSHNCVHIHPNNIANKSKLNGVETIQAMEFTFYRNDLSIETEYQTSFPHSLDSDNNPKQSSVALPKSWYKNS